MIGNRTARHAPSLLATWSPRAQRAHALVVLALVGATLALTVWTLGHVPGVFNGADLLASLSCLASLALLAHAGSVLSGHRPGPELDS